MSVSLQAYLLYVDDDPQECELVLTLAESLPAMPRIQPCASITEAQDILIKALRGMHSDLPLPSLLLLDYHLGVHTGVDLLTWMKTEPRFGFPTAIFSNCDREEDIHACYRAGAAYFLKKPNSCKELQDMLCLIRECMSTGKAEFDRLRLLGGYCPPIPDASQNWVRRARNRQ